MKIKFAIFIFSILLIVSCSNIAPVTKVYKSESIDKVCIFADFENRDFRKALETEIAVNFKNSSTEAFESYILIPKNTRFSSYEVGKKLKSLQINYYLYLTRLDDDEGKSPTDEVFTEFGKLDNIIGRPQIAAKIIDSEGNVIWTSALSFEPEENIEFPFEADKYIKSLIEEMAKSNLITINEK